MTATIVSLALLLNPSPISAPKEAHSWVKPADATTVVASQPISSFDYSTSPVPDHPALFVATVSTAAIEPPPEPPPLTLRERALNRLAELGAPQWVINGFDCVGWYESKWQNVRSRTADDGVLQINDVHDPDLWRLGLDPYVPEDAAEFAWRLFTRSGWSFRDWTVRGLCGLR